MNTGKVAGGAIMLILAIWVFMAMSDFTARFVGGSIIGILALVLLIEGFKEK